MLLKYEDIVSTDITKLNIYLKEGQARSFPVPILNNDNIRDIYFIYTALRENAFISPSGRICLDPVAKKVEWYMSSSKQGFAYMNNSKIQFKQIRTYSEVEKHIELYKKIYPQIRMFAFEKVLSDEQREVLKKYRSTYDVLIDSSQKVLYNNISPDFFKWMEKHTS